MSVIQSLNLFHTYTVFNQSFVTGIIPVEFKTSLVTPIYKANAGSQFENYRPISVLTCFTKILEKRMDKRLIKCVEKTNILTDYQYGFRKNRSTELAMIELVNRITEQIDKGKYTIGIFLDLSKAFDTIDHKIIMDKLNYYGIRGITNRWFENYLKNRKQIVKYKQITSIEMVTKTGVPQGSILGPLLFLLYVNDIQNCCDIVSSILFADDTSVLHSHSCLKTLTETLQIEINKID